LLEHKAGAELAEQHFVGNLIVGIQLVEEAEVELDLQEEQELQVQYGAQEKAELVARELLAPLDNALQILLSTPYVQ
jgi:hypothetical protein